MDKRLTELVIWLEDTLSIEIDSLDAASQDASFRRYFRVVGRARDDKFPSSLIVMDAPPDKESLDDFIAIDQLLVTNKVHAPSIHAINLAQGFLLLEDLGNRTYLDELRHHSRQLYGDALDALLAIQSVNDAALIDEHNHDSSLNRFVPPIYDKQLIESELNLFIDWYCERHLNVTLSDHERQLWADLKNTLVGVFKQQPQVLVHRDFHSRNLMVTEHRSPGVIDFQDMVSGPISYDLVSLFKDCYIEWPRATQLDWLQTYLDKRQTSQPSFQIDFEQLIEWYDLTGLQRHIKVLGIFCRLNYRDHKNHYLNDLPLVEKYVKEVLNLYPQFDDFRRFFNRLNTNHA